MSRLKQWPAELQRVVWRALRLWWRAAVSSARLAVGVPDYDNYVRHLQQHHPEREVPDYATFFRRRQEARYAKGSSRCC